MYVYHFCKYDDLLLSYLLTEVRPHFTIIVINLITDTDTINLITQKLKQPKLRHFHYCIVLKIYI